MNVAATVKKNISDSGPDTLWTYGDFSDLPMQSVAKALSRLASDGMIRRVKKGLYYFPRMTALGPSQPSADSLLKKTILPSGNSAVAYSGGTASFQNLGITTQVPAQYTILSDQPSRKIKVGGISARIIHRNFDPLRTLSQLDVWILDAIRNIRHVPDATPSDDMQKILHSILSQAKPQSQVRKLLKVAPSQPPRVRAVLGAIAEQLGCRATEIQRIKDTLNPLTKFNLGIASALPNAHAWGIS